MEKVILTGYMGSGKTTIARLLSKASGLNHIDLDEYIETKEGKTISEIFAEKGEIKFRKIEHESLKEIMDSRQGFVLSLGGGTPCYANNHEFLKQEDVVSVYLKTSIWQLIERIKESGIKRPIIDNLSPEELEEFVAKHLFDRSYFYMQAKHKISTDGKTPKFVVDEIMSLF